jgi:uncharacterized protein YjbI with pentapeptide repeats
LAKYEEFPLMAAAQLDTQPPSPERQADLDAQCRANTDAGRPPYWHVHIHTHGELQWIMQQRGWRGTIDEFNEILLAAEDDYIQIADFRGANFSHANLSGAKLVQANLSQANLLETNLSNANLVDGDLHDARLRLANLSSANLQNANLTHAHCRNASFAGANLTFASLQGARLPNADLRDARLVGAYLDASTVLSGVQLNDQTQLADIIWNNALLTRVNWEQIHFLGDEQFNVDRGAKRGSQIQGYRNAARAYSGLAGALKAQDLSIPAGRFRLRAQRLERRATRLEGKYASWAGSCILDAVAGYGERPGRSFVAYLLVVLTFAIAYFAIGLVAGPTLSPSGALIFSLTSFHGRGFFPGTLTSIDGPFPALAALEAVTGLFIELVFIATFSKRFLGN